MFILFIGGILLLGITIIVHELGHLLLGKWVGIKAEIFSIGYGKGIWKKRIGDTTFQITAIPLGGYVKFYGDDYFKDYNKEPEQGAFFSKPPLIRIIPVLGGPLFNLLLGFFIFFLLGFFPRENPPIIQIWEESTQSPAILSGLKNGDYVISVNNQEVKNFRELQEKIILSSGSSLNFLVKRISDNKEEFLNITVIPDVDPAGRASIGIRIPGERALQVDFPFMENLKYNILKIFNRNVEPPSHLPAMKYLDDGDIILEVEGKNISSTLELQRLLGSLENETVTLKVKRLKYPWLIPWITEIKEVIVPFKKEYRVVLKEVKDLKYNEIVGNIQLSSYIPEHLRAMNFMSINSQPISSFQQLYHLSMKISNEKVLLQINESLYEAFLEVERIGLIGFRPNSVIEPEIIYQKNNVLQAFKYALDNTFTNIAIYPKFFEKLFSGRISFIDNTMGPVGMFAIAGIVIQSSIYEYLQLMAIISIALMVVNLIPFPVVDGGHIVLFLIEAIRKKRLSVAVIEGLHKTAFIILISLGLWIMFKDILFVLGL